MNWRHLFFPSAWLRPANALVLLLEPDPQPPEEHWAEVLGEIQKYYRIAPLSDLVRRLQKGRPLGVACVALSSFRKSVSLRWRPFFRGLGIPWTVFVETPFLGTNRLPLQEELEVLAGKGTLATHEAENLQKLLWQDPAQAIARFEQLRRHHPLPLGELNPLQFFGRWRDLLELQSEPVEFGWRPAVEFQGPREAELQPFLFHLKKQPHLALAPEHGPACPWQDLGIEGVVTQGVLQWVTEKTQPLQIPHWRPEKKEKPRGSENPSPPTF